MSNLIKTLFPTSFETARAESARHRADWSGKIGYNTWLSPVGYGPGRPSAYTVTHHETAIVTYHEDGRIVLDCEGYRSPTTKRRLCALLPTMGTEELKIYWTVFQHKHEWYLSAHRVRYHPIADGETFPRYAGSDSDTWKYVDGVTLAPDPKAFGGFDVTLDGEALPLHKSERVAS